MFQNLTEKEYLSRFLTRVNNDLKFQILHFYECSYIKIPARQNTLKTIAISFKILSPHCDNHAKSKKNYFMTSC